MANYSDLNFDNGQYIPQYAGAPLKEIQQTADTLSARHYENIAKLGQLDVLANQMKSRLLPGAKSGVDPHISSIKSTLEEIARTGGENATMRIQALATALQGNQSLLNAQQRAKEYEEENAIIAGIKAKGDTPLFDAQRRRALEEAGIDDEIYNSPYQSTAEHFRNPNPEMEDIWKEVNPDSFEGALRVALDSKTNKPLAQSLADNDLRTFYETITSSGISSSKIKNQLENAWANYKNTPSFKQQTGKLIGKSEAQLKDEFLKKGLTRVFSNLQRDYIKPPASPSSGDESDASFLTTPLPATIKTQFDTGFDIEDIDDQGNVKKSTLTKGLEGPKRLVVEGDLKTLKSRRSMLGNTSLDAEIAAKEAELAEFNKPDEQRTQEMLGIARTALSVVGSGGDQYDPKQMTDSEVKAFAGSKEGKAIIKEYMDNYLSTRYQQPFIRNITDKKTRDAAENFISGNLTQREFINMDTGEHFKGLKDENGKVNKDLLELSKMSQEGKLNPNGIVEPKNPFTAVKNAGENFTRGVLVEVPAADGSGNSTSYLISQLPGTTSTVDHNENVLWNATNKAPGGEVDFGGGIKAIAPVSPTQKQVLWDRYKLEGSGIPRDKYNENNVVIMEINGEPIIFADYTQASNYLAEQGIKLRHKK